MAGTGPSSNRPPDDWQFRFVQNNPEDCGIQIKTAVVADSGNWTIQMAGEQITRWTVNLNSKCIGNFVGTEA